MQHWTKQKFDFWKSGRIIRFEFDSKMEAMHFLIMQNDDQFALSQQKDESGELKWYYSTPRTIKYFVDQVA